MSAQTAGPDNATEQTAAPGNVTEHVIARWQALAWRDSKDCKHVIQVLLALRTVHQHSQLQGILAQTLPPFLTPNPEDAFIAVLQQGTITDVNLRDSIVDFFAKWRSERVATIRELLADPAVAREANVLWPFDFPMRRWITSRLRGDVELKEEEEEVCTWTIHLTPQSRLKKQIYRRYTEIQRAAAQNR